MQGVLYVFFFVSSVRRSNVHRRPEKHLSEVRYDMLLTSNEYCVQKCMIQKRVYCLHFSKNPSMQTDTTALPRSCDRIKIWIPNRLPDTDSSPWIRPRDSADAHRDNHTLNSGLGVRWWREELNNCVFYCFATYSSASQYTSLSKVCHVVVE